MESQWVYHTSVRPRNKRIEGEDGNNEYKNEFKKAFDSFLEDCKIPVCDLEESMNGKDVYCHTMVGKDDDDEINKHSKYHVRFLKSRFLTNPKFKRELINYYNPIGYFVRGPSQNSNNEWVLEFSHKIGY
jgi:hypothetical protein